MCSRHFVVLFCLFNVYVSITDGSEVLRSTYCYGDSSHGNNLIDVTCSSGVIRVIDVITATKPSALGCPADDHDYTPAQQQSCCTYDASDCMSSYTGNTDSYFRCTGKPQCEGVPIVRQPSGCNSTTHPPFTNYLIFEYRCVQDGLLNGACTTTSDCTVNETVCTNSICVCRTGYSEIDETCKEDGIPNGACLSGDNPCTDENSFCSSTNNLCTCRSGYTEDKGICIKITSQVRRPVYCHGDSSHNSNLIDVTCTSGVIYVKNILTGSKPSSYNCPENDHTYSPAEAELCCSYNASDCIAPFTGPAQAYYACTGKTHCSGIPIVKQRNQCGPTYPDFSNFLIFEYVCVPEGHIHGSCSSESEPCIDRNSECFDELCRCVDGFSDRDHACWEDGSPGVECLPDQTCLDPNAVCSPTNNTCVCNSGYSLVDGVCMEDCSSNADCSRSFTECSEGVCDCIAGYGFVYGVCKQVEEIDGPCSIGGTCRDGHAVCAANNVCVCKNGYSFHNGACRQDGTLGAVCGTSINIECVDVNAECSPPEDGQCGCVNGYQNVSGVCKEDGCVGCSCQQDAECTDPHSECGTDSTCRCMDGYSDIDGTCRLDGSVDGSCLPADMCTDPHAVCVDGRCKCNDVRNYKHEAGTCVREDGYIHGKCDTAVPCNDVHAYCSRETGLCVCNNNYVEINGICELGTTHSVTSCSGSSSYNTLVPDCDKNSFALKTRTYNRSKRATPACQQNLDVYDHAYFLSCCTQDSDDCAEGDIGTGACSSVYYEVVEYVCIYNNQSIDVDQNGETDGTDVGVSYPDGQADTDIPGSTPISVYTCSIQASCLTDINVFVLRNTLEKVNGLCTCNISMIGDGSLTTVNCDGPAANHYTSLGQVTNGFIQVQIDYRGTIRRGFTLLFRAVDRNAVLTATCGLGAKKIGISNLDTCQAIGKGDEITEVNQDGDTTGSDGGICSPGYKNDTEPDWDSEPSTYTCSIQASCVTDINVYVLINTLEKVNGVCSCNVSIIGDGDSTEVTCDSPRPSRSVRFLSVTSGFVRAQIGYHDRIKGHFLILFRAVHKNAFLTMSCGSRAKTVGIGNLPSCRPLGTGPPCTGVDGDSDTDGGHIAEITNPDPLPPTGLGEGVYHCSVQASCVTAIDVHILLNTLQKVNAICSCNISIIGEGQGQSTDVTCDGPAANRYTPIVSVTNGFVRAEIRYRDTITGAFIIRFQAVNRNARLTATCGAGAKLYGIQNLQTCTVTGTDDTSLEVDDDDEVTGPGCSVTNPGYPSENVPSSGNGPSVYYCSIQASCLTNINAFVILNTLREKDGVCSCNITLNGDGTSSDVTCDGPAGNYFTPIFTVVNGFIRADVHYHGTINGSFVIMFRAVEAYARLTAGCGNRAKQVGLSNLGTCSAYGTDDSSLEVHKNETRNNTDVSVTNPGYGGGSVPGNPGITLYQCSVQASCLTKINAFLLINTLQKTNDVCSCNITLTSGTSTTEVTCEGPAHNRHAPILSTSTGFVKVEVAYRSSNTGNFVIEFRAVERNAVLSLSCGTKAVQSGVPNLGACPSYEDDDSTIAVDDSTTIGDKEVSVTQPSAQPSTGTRGYTCSVQASCTTSIDAFVISNKLQKINGICSSTITIIGSVVSTTVTCDGPGSNRFTPIFTEPSGFLRVQADYTDGVHGQFELKFKGRDVDAIVNVSCGSHALDQSLAVSESCTEIDQPNNASGGGGGNNILVIIIVVVVIVFVLLVLVILCWVCRQRIRSKLCPQQSKPSIEPTDPGTIIERPLLEGPLPMNTKFPGRVPDNAIKTNKKLDRMASSSSVVDYLYKEQMDSEKNTTIPTASTMPIFTKEREDAVVRTKFKRRPTIQDDIVMAAQANVEAEKKKEKKGKKMAKFKKKLQKARVGISAAKAFELQKPFAENEPVGTYRPLGDNIIHNGRVHPTSLYPSSTMDPPPLPFTLHPRGHAHVHVPSGSIPGPGLPDFSASGMTTDHPRPGHAPTRLPPLPFSPSGAWRRAGAASAVAGHMMVRKKKTLDISSVDDPGNVEHNDLY